MKRVTRTVSELEYHCEYTSRFENSWVTEYEERCQYVRKPVQRTRTVYRSRYDLLDGLGRRPFVPRELRGDPA